jgi:hypothetical protein
MSVIELLQEGTKRSPETHPHKASSKSPPERSIFNKSFGSFIKLF